MVTWGCIMVHQARDLGRYYYLLVMEEWGSVRIINKMACRLLTL